MCHILTRTKIWLASKSHGESNGEIEKDPFCDLDGDRGEIDGPLMLCLFFHACNIMYHIILFQIHLPSSLHKYLGLCNEHDLCLCPTYFILCFSPRYNVLKIVNGTGKVFYRYEYKIDVPLENKKS